MASTSTDLLTEDKPVLLRNWSASISRSAICGGNSCAAPSGVKAETSADNIPVCSSAESPYSDDSGVFSGSPRKGANGKSVLRNPTPEAKQAGASREPRNSTDSAAPAAILATTSATAPEVVVLSSLSLLSKPTGTAQQAISTQSGAESNRLTAFTSEPATASSDAAGLAATATASAVASVARAVELQASPVFATILAPAAESATRAASSTAASAIVDLPKSKPQAQLCSARSDIGSGSTAANGVIPTMQANQHTLNLHPASARENFADNNSAAAHSVLQPFSDQAGGRSRTQAASQAAHAPTVPEKSSGTAPGDRDSGTSLAPAASAHPSSVQATAVPLAAADAAPMANPSATQFAVQSATQSISPAFAQPSPAFTQAPAQTQPQLQADASVAPERMVDSGQLRVTQSNSELKISVQLPELGKVEVRAITAHDVTTAHLTAFRQDALPALAAERTGLEQALKSRDVILGSFNSHGQSAGQQRQPSSYSSAQPSGGALSLAAAATLSATAEASTSGFLPDYSSISVHV